MAGRSGRVPPAVRAVVLARDRGYCARCGCNLHAVSGSVQTRDATFWWIDRMATSPCPIVEKMALFWHGHFTSGRDKAPMQDMWDQIQLYRTEGLGSFFTLAQAMAIQPAMLRYLDNLTNMAPNHINANFARELMELFLLGPGTYTANDVTEVARAWTGHGLDADGNYTFTPRHHDSGTKTVLGYTGPWNGPDTITLMLLGRTHTDASRFIARALWSFLAHPDPPASLVDELARGFIDARYDLKKLVRSIFMRPEFRSDTCRNGLLRTPIEWVAATLKYMDMPASVVRPDFFFKDMGQVPFWPPNVTGWPTNDGWLGTTATWGRGNYLTTLGWRSYESNLPYQRFPGLETLEPRVIALLLCAVFGIVDPSPNTLQVIEDWAAELVGTNAAWSIRLHAAAITGLTPEFQLA